MRGRKLAIFKTLFIVNNKVIKKESPNEGTETCTKCGFIYRNRSWR